jgi:nucleoside-diphosphate-sugar epimerase
MARKVLVTGGAGQLGRALARHLGPSGPPLTRYDLIGGDGVIQGDVNDLDAVLAAVKGHDAVVHAAALHGLHLFHHSEQEFVRVNVQGTQTVLHACAEAGVGHLVLLSSTSVYGLSGSAPVDRTVLVDENTPCKPRDANDLCKVMCEMVAEYAVRRYGISVTVLRPGRFFVEDPITFNIDKLSGSVDADDVALAVSRALASGGDGYQVYCVSAGTRFAAADLRGLSDRADAVIEERYPGAAAALAIFGRRLPSRVHRIVDISRARDRLGYVPLHTFGAFVRGTLASDPATACSSLGGAQ